MKALTGIFYAVLIMAGLASVGFAADPQPKPMTEEEKAMQAKMQEFKGMIITCERVK